MQQIEIQRNLPCLIVDGSYYTFYRYFATLRWYQFKDPNPVFEELHKNDAFVTPFMKHVKDEINSMCKRWKTVKENIVFCRDCPRGCIWRHEHTSAYKGTRVLNNKFNPNIFRLVYEFLAKENIPVLDIDTLEADDIAALTKSALRTSGFENDVVFITNDNDYLQLLDDKTDAFNLHEKNGSLRKRSSGNPMKDLRIKILMGDKSDNIPPVMQRMGTKTAEKLSELPEDELRRQLENKKNGDLTAWEQYEINRKLIDLSWMMRNHQQNFDERVHVNIV